MKESTGSRPNIILISTDQQRGDCIGLDPLAPQALQTPNLNWIARSGTHFLQGYSECPSCIPARRCLMSGTAPAANGMVGFGNRVEWQPAHTLAGELSKAGYQTEMIGKLHLHPPRKRYGFDHLQLADTTRGEDNDFVEWLEKQHHCTAVDPDLGHGVSSNGWVGRPHHAPEEQMYSFWCANQAMEFFQKRDPSMPFFLNISFNDPHPPLTPPAFYYERYINRDLPEPVVGDWAPQPEGPEKGYDPNAEIVRLEEQDIQCMRAAYYGMINFVDDQIGRIMQFATKELRESLIIFVSDHGEMLGDHNLYRKTWPYQASARVPFIIRAPKSWGCPEELVCNSPVGLQDVMPTILDAAGVEIPETCTGKSLLPVVRGEAAGVRELLHGEHAGCYQYDEGNHYITDGRKKYIWYSQTGVEHLFDLENDPNELRDLARSDKAEELLEPWREALIGILKDRPEGFTDGSQLIAGRRHDTELPDYSPERSWDFL